MELSIHKLNTYYVSSNSKASYFKRIFYRKHNNNFSALIEGYSMCRLILSTTIDARTKPLLRLCNFVKCTIATSQERLRSRECQHVYNHLSRIQTCVLSKYTHKHIRKHERTRTLIYMHAHTKTALFYDCMHKTIYVSNIKHYVILISSDSN